MTLYDIPVNQFAYRLSVTHPQYNFVAIAGTLKEDTDENADGVSKFSFEMKTPECKATELTVVPFPKN